MNTLEFTHSEFREDLTIEGTPIKIEVKGEVYADPIFKSNDNYKDINTWIVLIQHFDDKEFESGREYYEGKVDEDSVKKRVEYLKANPFELMYDNYANKYDINKKHNLN